ncbi:MAG: hypothetical protein AAB492_04335 [Patescibacteria group bacterium]
MAKIIGITFLLFAIGFNLWTYRMEPTAKTDPNDNTFQYALVDRTNQIWDFALSTRNFLLLFDHWVPNWAQGYNLPYYYSHIPQIIIVASWRIFYFGSLFQYYHYVIYLLLCLFPLSLFVALRIIGLSWISAGLGALIASHLSTDGLYGLDPASFLWRGYGLSSQLFAMIWLPLVLAYAFRGKIKPTILTLALTTAGHLGIGIIAFFSVAIVGFKHIKKLPIIYGGVLLLLGYWIIPILKDSAYHNISVWDPIWKFDSYGYREVLKNLFNGDLFDFGRLPVLTLLVFIGIFVSLLSIEHWSLGILFLFWLLFYFGRTTWGGLINLIPSMEEFHLSRFIVGVHIAGLFLIPIGFEWIIKKFRPATLLIVCIGLLVYPQTLRYSAHNDFLIKRANTNASKVESDTAALLETLRSTLSTNPGRVYFGRGGGWGKDFRVAETPMYLYMSTFGIPTLTWLPETWSPNSDTEQYFSENMINHYTLYNVRYVVTPIDLPQDKIQPFWKLLTASKTWRIYTVDTEGYITAGFRPTIVSTDKQSFRNVVRLWIQSDNTHAKNLYPQLTFDTNYPKNSGLPNFRMIDEVTYKVPDGSTHNLFAEAPIYQSPITNTQIPTILSQSNDNDMIFKATIDVPENCTECIVILHQTYHPSWKATIDGKLVETLIVFPFYTAVKVDSGKHELVFSYRPSGIKIVLLMISLITLGSLLYLCRRALFSHT